MKNQLLIMIVVGLAANWASYGQTGGSAGGASASGATTGAAASAGRASTGRVMAPQATATPVQNQNGTTLLQQQQALRQQQILEAQQQSVAGGLQQSGSAQNAQPQSTLGAQTGAAAQPPQVGIATGLSATPAANGTQPSTGLQPGSVTPGTLNRLNNGAVTATPSLNNGAATAQVVLPDGSIATLPIAPGTGAAGNINNSLGTLPTNGAGAVVPTVGALGTLPAGTAVGTTVTNINNTIVAGEPNPVLPRPVLVQRTAKPALAMDDLPSAVQKALKGELGDGTLYNLEKATNSHGTTYRASFKNDNKYRQLEIAEDGSLINNGDSNTPAVIAATVTPTAATGQTIKANALPVAVLNAVKAYGSQSEIENIELVPSGDKSIYKVRVNHDGSLSELQIAKDGKVEKKVVIDPLARPLSTPLPANEVATSTVTSEGSLEIPAAVRNTIRAQGGGTEVQDIQLTTVDGHPVYQVKTEKEGKTASLQIGQDGKIINGQGLTVALTDLPEKVQNEVKSQVGGAVITGIQKEARDGRSVYNIRYNAKNGADTHLILREDGTAFPASPRTALGRPAGTTVSTLQLSDLPQAARKTIVDQAGTTSIDNLSVRTRQGETVYAATYRKNGVSQSVEVSSDGTIIKSE